MGDHNIKIGEIYLHSAGLKYKVDKLIFDATNYEDTGELKEKVLYTQLEDGKECPKGTQYVRETNDFLNNFKLID